MTGPADFFKSAGANRSRRLLAFGFGTLLLLVLAAVASNAEQFTTPGTRTGGQRAVLPIERDLAPAADTDPIRSEDAVEPPEWLVVGVAIIGGIGLLYLLSRQRFSFRFRRPTIRLTSSRITVTEEEEADAIAEIARDLIDELNEGDSPRLAIQRAYAAVETGFGAPELARKPAETPLRYLDRIFGRHGSLQAPLEQLTDLFQRARFSADPIDESMRGDAIEALTEIRDYYTAFAWRKISRSRSKAASQ